MQLSADVPNASDKGLLRPATTTAGSLPLRFSSLLLKTTVPLSARLTV